MAENEINIVVTATDKASAALKGVRGSIITLDSALNIAQKAFAAVQKVLEESIQAYVKYADEVRQLSRLNGTSAEETSRLIQVMDDHKVSTQNLMMATRKLSQQGLSLTIDSLAKMSDEYLALGSSSEKTRFLLDKFGRSGLQMAETMEQGSAAINSQAAAINKNLILDERAIRTARQYEIALDQLNDTKQGLAVTVGTKVVPAWTDFLERLNNVISATDKYSLQQARLINQLHQMPIDSATRSYMAMAEALGLVEDAAAEAGEEAEDLSGEFSNILSFAEGYRSNQEAMKTLEEELADARKRGYSEYGNKIKDIKAKIEEQKAAEQDWTNKFIFNMAQMQAAADGLDPTEAAGLLEMAKQLGIIDQKAIDSYNSLMRMNGLKITNSVTTTYKSVGIFQATTPGQGGQISGEATGGAIPKGGMAWVGDTLAGGMAHAELVYAPQGAYVFNSAQSRSMGSGSPKAATGGIIPPMGGEMSLSSSTIRQLASEIAGAMSRQNG